MKLRICSVLLLLVAVAKVAPAQESALEAQLRGEKDRVVESCGSFSFGTIPGCGYTLFTDHPFHIAAGSLPPLNGFGLGVAFVWAKNARNWRLSWDADAVASTNASWRAGVYMKIVHNPHPKKPPIAVIIPGETPSGSSTSTSGTSFTHPYTFYDVYAQSMSLNQLYFFGLGNDSPVSGKSVFGMRETIVGISATKPVFEWTKIQKLHLTLLGEANGRFVSIRPDAGQSVPSIDSLYNNSTAPGLSAQPGFAQFGEGVRIAPSLGNFEFNYLGRFQQFFSPSDSHDSFLRWTIDLNHIYYLRERVSASQASVPVGPDSCATSDDPCPPIPHTFNNTGSIGVRLLLSESVTSASSAVPFYFQPTLGGQNIDSSLGLGSYQDYRFRAPNVLLLQETFEHSVWGPFGLTAQFDQGQVALAHSDFGISNFKHSYAAGITLRAGAFPMVYLLFAWGGNEGTHTIANMNTALLGGTPRPSLY